MKLYIKQKFWSWVRDFTVYDAAGNGRYRVQGEFMSLRTRLHVTDVSGQEVAYMERSFSWRPRFAVWVRGREVCEIVKDFTWFRQSYHIEGLDWKAEGDFTSHEFMVTGPKGTVAEISREWFTLGDAYELNIAPGTDELTALAVVLAIDCVLASQAAAASSAST